MANVAPPSDSWPANSARPEIVNCSTGPLAITPMVSPTAKPSSSAVPASITTSSGLSAHEPSVSSVGLKR